MNSPLDIVEVRGREILDSRGNPTVEAEVTLENGAMGRACAPSGAFTRPYEAAELRDGARRYHGKGVRRAVEHVNNILAESVLFENSVNQRRIDRLLTAADGTEDKGNMGANAILAVSMAVSRAAAAGLGIPLYRYLGGIGACRLPSPMMNMLNGGRHADNTVDFKEFMIMPASMDSFSDSLAMCSEIYHTLKKLLSTNGFSTDVGDEGGFVPGLKNSKEALTCLSDAVKLSGYEPGRDIFFAIDAAAGNLYDRDSGMYLFPGESRMDGIAVERTADQMIEYYDHLVDAFPIFSIEDGLWEEDWEGWRRMTETLGHKVRLVGDDLFATNAKRLKKGIEEGAANAILIKVNQTGTLTESFEAVEMAKRAGFATVISHRTGETEDSIIADISVAVNSGQIKTGAPCRSERTAKYNQLLRIEENLWTPSELHLLNK